MKRNYITKILMAALYIFMLVFVFNFVISSAKNNRANIHYKNVVFDKYKDYKAENDEYLTSYISLLNGFYDKATPLYHYKKTATAENSLEFDLRIMRVSFVKQRKVFLFFTKDVRVDGIIITLKDVVYKPNGKEVDIMKNNRLIGDTYKPENPLMFELHFQPAVLDKIKMNDKDGNLYRHVFDPITPLALTEDMLILNDGSFASLRAFTISAVKFDDKGKMIADEKVDLFHAYDGEGPKLCGDTAEVSTDLKNIDQEHFKIGMNTYPTHEEIVAKGLEHEEVNLKQYNKTLVLPIIIVTILAVLFGYLLFAHKYVKQFIQERRDQKRLAAREANKLALSPTDEEVSAPVMDAEVSEIESDDPDLPPLNDPKEDN